ncbi:MAG: OmpA family protein [Candidatus Woesearchaeota archaeon]
MKKHVVLLVIALVFLSAMVVSVQSNLLSIDAFMDSFQKIETNRGVASNPQEPEAEFWEEYASFKKAVERGDFDNTRASSKYSGKPVFLAESDDWREVMKATTLSVWDTEGFGDCPFNPFGLENAKGRCQFPLFVLHENDLFSVEDTLSRMEAQKSGDDDWTYDYMMFSSQDDGDVSFDGTSLDTISRSDYPYFWSDFDTAVVVSDDYETALQGAIIAGHLNAPLFIRGYDNETLINDLLDSDEKDVVVLSSSATDFSWKEQDMASCYVDMSIVANTPDLYKLHMLFDSSGHGVESDDTFFNPMLSKLVIYNPEDISECQDLYGSFFKNSGMASSPSVLCKDSLMVPYLAVAYNQLPLSLADQKTLKRFAETGSDDLDANLFEKDIHASYDLFEDLDSYFGLDADNVDARFKDSLNALNKGRRQLETVLADEKKVPDLAFEKSTFTFVANPYSAPLMRKYYPNTPSLSESSAPGSLYLLLPFFDKDSFVFSEELSTGLVTGLTVSDTSSLVMKNIFLSNMGDDLIDHDKGMQGTGNPLHVVFGSTNPSAYDYLDFASLTHLPIEKKFSTSVSRAEYFTAEDSSGNVISDDELFSSPAFLQSLSRQVVFEYDKTELVDYSKKALNTIMRILLLPDRQPTIDSLQSFGVEAHTDHKGTDSYNDNLSSRRAHVIKEFLIKSCYCQCEKLQRSEFNASEGAFVPDGDDSDAGSCTEDELAEIKTDASSECASECSSLSQKISAQGLGEDEPRTITRALYEELCDQSGLSIFDDGNDITYGKTTCAFLESNIGETITKDLLDSIAHDPDLEKAVRALNRRAEFAFDPEKPSSESGGSAVAFDASSEGELRGDIFYYLGDVAPWITSTDDSSDEYDLVELYKHLKPLPGYSPYYMFDSSPVMAFGDLYSLLDEDINQPPLSLLLTRFGGRGVYGFDARSSLFGQQEYFADVLFSDLDSPTFAGEFSPKLQLQFVKNTPEKSCLSRGASDCASSLQSRARNDFANRFRFLGVPQATLIPKDAKQPGRFSCLDGESKCGSKEYLEGEFPEEKHFIISSRINRSDLFNGGETNTLLSSLMPSVSEAFLGDARVDFLTSSFSSRLFSYPLLENRASVKQAGENAVEVLTYVASPYELEGMVSLVNDYDILELDSLPARHAGDFKTPDFNDYNAVGSDDEASNSFRKFYRLDCEVASEDLDSFIAATDSKNSVFEYDARKKHYGDEGSGSADWNVYRCSAKVQPSVPSNKNFPFSAQQAVVFDVAKKGTSAVFKRDILKTTTFASMRSIHGYNRLFTPSAETDDGIFYSAADFFTDDGDFAFKMNVGTGDTNFKDLFTGGAFDVIAGLPSTEGSGEQLPSEALASQFSLVTYTDGVPSVSGSLGAADLKSSYGFGVDSVFSDDQRKCFNLSDYFAEVRSFINAQSSGGASDSIDRVMPTRIADGLVDENYLDPDDVTEVAGRVVLESPVLLNGRAEFPFSGKPDETFSIPADELKNALVDKPGVLDSFKRTASFSFMLDNVSVEYEIAGVDRLYRSEKTPVTENNDSIGVDGDPGTVSRSMILSRACENTDERTGRDFTVHMQEAELLNKIGVRVS